MNINNVDCNNIVLDHGVIQIEASWCGGSQVELDICLYIESQDKHYSCNSIESAFSKYYEIIEVL